MEQYLVLIREGDDQFYRLVDDVESLDNLFGIYGVYRTGDGHGINGCWKMKQPRFDERLGENVPEGMYPDAEIISLKGDVNADAI